MQDSFSEMAALSAFVVLRLHFKVVPFIFSFTKDIHDSLSVDLPLVCVLIYKENQTWASPRKAPLNPRGRKTYSLFPVGLLLSFVLRKHGNGRNKEKRGMSNSI